MSELAIDMHRFIKRLMENGFTEAQAETLADTQMAFLESRPATKDELRAEIAGVNTRIDKVSARINKLESRLDTRNDALESQFKVMLLRSQIATGEAIVTILTFIDYITP